MDASTANLVRPALPMQQMSGGGSACESSACQASSQEGEEQHGGANADLPREVTVSRQVLLDLLKKLDIQLRDNSLQGVCWILTCNLLNIWMRVKAERRKVAVIRGAPVATSMLKKVTGSTPFVIPV